MSEPAQDRVIVNKPFPPYQPRRTRQKPRVAFDHDVNGHPVNHARVKTTCACCGSKVDRKTPLVDLNTNTVAWGKWTAKLRPVHVEILAVLVEAWPLSVSRGRLIERVWGESDRRDSDMVATLKTDICMLRKRLRSSGVTIETTQAYGFRVGF